MDCIRNRVCADIEKRLTPKRLRHTYAVADEAVKLAEIYGEDREKAELAALFHDMFRCEPAEHLNQLVEDFRLPERLKDKVNLSHGKVAAESMKRDYRIKDVDMVNAVAFHTTGRAGMSRLEKIIYLADAIEPGRSYPTVEETRKLAYDDLDAACINSLTRTIEYIEGEGGYLDPDTVNALMDLKEKRNL